MKLSCLPVSLFRQFHNGDMDLHDWIYLGKKLELQGIDINTGMIKNHSPVYLEEICNSLEKEAMEIVLVNACPDFTQPDYLPREREKEYFRRDIALASALGAKYIAMTAGQEYPGMERSSGIMSVISCFAEMTETADKYGIRLLFGNLSDPNLWKYPDFSLPLEIFAEIGVRTKDLNIGIMLDMGSLLAAGEEPLKILEEFLPRTEMILISDLEKKGEPHPAALGSGAVKYDQIFQFLNKNKYDKWLSIKEGSLTGKAGIYGAVRYIKNLYES